MSIQDDITIELARLERQAYDAIRAKMARGQLGEAWTDLVVVREPVEGDEPRAS